ncbi:MAG: hypothetical protein ACR2O6_00700 [Ilumatobacteraceae bacterium]
MNVVSPTIRNGLLNRVIFVAARTPLFRSRLKGLIVLSLIHYARWAIIRPKDFPHLDESQPEEDIENAYEFFFSNFNGSWDQYVDSFSMSLAGGLDLLWYKNVNYPNSVPIAPFHRYINANQIQTDHYYNAYPLATSNDVKSAREVRDTLIELAKTAKKSSDAEFETAYVQALIKLQNDLSRMEETPIVSLAHAAVVERQRVEGMEETPAPVVDEAAGVEPERAEEV